MSNIRAIICVPIVTFGFSSNWYDVRKLNYGTLQPTVPVLFSFYF